MDGVTRPSGLWARREHGRLRVPDGRITPNPATHKDLQPRHHWACEYPEMKPTPSTSWSSNCKACILHAVACVKTDALDGRRSVTFKASAGAPTEAITFAEALARSAEAVDDASFAFKVGADLAE